MMMSAVGAQFAMGFSPDGSNPLIQIVPFVIILGIFYFIILLPSKRKQQKIQQFLDNLTPAATAKADAGLAEAAAATLISSAALGTFALDFCNKKALDINCLTFIHKS